MLVSVLCISMASILFPLCTSTSYHSSRYKAGVNYIYSYPVMHLFNNRLISFNLLDTIVIVYYKRQTLYQLPKSRDFNTELKNSESNKYFLYPDDSSFGLLFKVPNNSNPIRLEVDSFITQNGLKGLQIKPSNSDIFLVSIFDSATGVLVEKFRPKEKLDEDSPDSFFYYYKKDFNNIPFSLSSELDEIKKLKLVKVKVIINETTSKKYKVNLPRREYLFEIVPISQDSLRNYNSIINKLIKGISKNYPFPLIKERN